MEGRLVAPGSICAETEPLRTHHIAGASFACGAGGWHCGRRLQGARQRRDEGGHRCQLDLPREDQEHSLPVLRLHLCFSQSLLGVWTSAPPSHLAAQLCCLQEGEHLPPSLDLLADGGVQEAPKVRVAGGMSCGCSEKAASASSRGPPGGRPLSSSRAAGGSGVRPACRHVHCAVLPSSSAPPSPHVSAVPAACRVMLTCQMHRHPCWSCSELRRRQR